LRFAVVAVPARLRTIRHDPDDEDYSAQSRRIANINARRAAVTPSVAPVPAT